MRCCWLARSKPQASYNPLPNSTRTKTRLGSVSTEMRWDDGSLPRARRGVVTRFSRSQGPDTPRKPADAKTSVFDHVKGVRSDINLLCCGRFRWYRSGCTSESTACSCRNYRHPGPVCRVSGAGTLCVVSPPPCPTGSVSIASCPEVASEPFCPFIPSTATPALLSRNKNATPSRRSSVGSTGQSSSSRTHDKGQVPRPKTRGRCRRRGHY